MAEKVLVLQGGRSSEREVSLRSAANVIHWLKETGYEVTVADPAEVEFDLPAAAARCDVVLPILHGKGGEDGVLQKQLEALGKPFLGSGSAACELTFDKARYREFMAGHGVEMAEGAVVSREQFATSPLRKKPYVLKPIAGGSSVDTVILHDLSKEPDETYFDDLFTRYGTMLLERLVAGRELTVGVLGDKALPVILVVPPSGEEFDYENKYNGSTQEIVNPPQIPAEVQKRARELALRLHCLTDCRHLSRSDMILADDGTLYVLETNTIPGMTEQSLFPKMAAAADTDMAALVKCFVNMALEV
jgi:D-alanine-D-alanine ligase